MCDKKTNGYKKRLAIRERYNITYTSYNDLYREEQFEKYKASIIRYPPKGKVLDDGCGTALLLEYLSENDTENSILDKIIMYVCLDISENMLHVARKTANNLNLDHLLEFVEADSENIPFRNKAFDTVFSFTVFMLLDHPERGINEAKRVCKSYAVYSILKTIPMLKLPNKGIHIAETSKDHIFLLRCKNVNHII